MSLFRTFLLLFTWASVCTSLFPQLQYDIMTKGTVMIETTDESGDVFLGSGIVIANHEDTILIATAKHNVSSVDNDFY